MLGRPPPAARCASLTPRERAVLAAMAEGKSNLGIAETLFVSEAAVEKHVTAIFRKLAIVAREHRAPPRPRRADVPPGHRTQPLTKSAG